MQTQREIFNSFLLTITVLTTLILGMVVCVGALVLYIFLNAY